MRLGSGRHPERGLPSVVQKGVDPKPVSAGSDITNLHHSLKHIGEYIGFIHTFVTHNNPTKPRFWNEVFQTMTQSGATNQPYDGFNPEKSQCYFRAKTAEDGVSFGLTLDKRTSALPGFVISQSAEYALTVL